MVVLSAVVFTLSERLGLYLRARDPRKCSRLVAVGLCGFALLVMLDTVRNVSTAHT
nr:hypothetical protein [Mycobacterium uberis]